MSQPVTVSLDKPTLWRVAVRDIVAMIVVAVISGGVYTGVTLQLSILRSDFNAERDQRMALTRAIQELAVQVAKLEGRLEGK